MLAVVYLIFNEGYTATSGDELTREPLTSEAIRLGRLLADLLPDEPEVAGLLALMLLTDARRAARTTADGDLVLLADQDRGRWDAALIAEGRAIVRSCLARNRPGPYQIQAAINAVHTDDGGTDWRQIVTLYDQLLAIAPSPVAELHRAVAVAEVDGAGGGAGHRGRRSTSSATTSTTRCAPTCSAGWAATAEAVAAYDEAISRTDNAAERRFLEGRRAELAGQ